MSRVFQKLLEEIGPASAGTGSLNDLGELPVVGVTSKKSKKKERPKFIQIEAFLHEIEESDLEDEEVKQGIDLEAEDRISTDGEDDFESAPIYGKEDPNVENPDLSVQDAEQILQQEDPNAPPPLDPNAPIAGEEEEEEVAKVPMSLVLKYKVHRTRSNRHANPRKQGTHFDPITLKDMRIGERLLFLMEEGEEEAKGSTGPQVVLAKLTHNQGSYVLSTTITTGNENKDYIFEGDRSRMIAILTVLGSSLRDRPGTPQDAISFATKTTQPVELVVNYDRLLTYGQSYAQQVIAK